MLNLDTQAKVLEAKKETMKLPLEVSTCQVVSVGQCVMRPSQMNLSTLSAAGAPHITVSLRQIYSIAFSCTML